MRVCVCVHFTRVIVNRFPERSMSPNTFALQTGQEERRYDSVDNRFCFGTPSDATLRRLPPGDRANTPPLGEIGERKERETGGEREREGEPMRD